MELALARVDMYPVLVDTDLLERCLGVVGLVCYNLFAAECDLRARDIGYRRKIGVVLVVDILLC